MELLCPLSRNKRETEARETRGTVWNGVCVCVRRVWRWKLGSCPFSIPRFRTPLTHQKGCINDIVRCTLRNTVIAFWSFWSACETGWLGNWCILVGIRYRLSYLFYTPMVTVSSCVRVYIGLIARVILYLVFFFFSFFLIFFIEGKKERILYSNRDWNYMYVFVSY